MSDVVDRILEGLSPAALEILDKIDLDADRESRHYSQYLQESLSKLEEARLKRLTQDMTNKAEALARKTREYKAMLEKYREEFEKIQCDKNYTDHSQKISVYTQQIDILQKQLSKLTKTTDVRELEELDREIKDMQKKIEELELKNNELSNEMQCYEGFPADMREAQICISDLKERIKRKEALLQ